MQINMVRKPDGLSSEKRIDALDRHALA